MATADDVMYDNTIDQLSVDDLNPTTNEKRVNYVTDQNNGSYAGEITFDGTSLVGGDQYVSWKESYIQIPMQTTLTNGAVASTTAISAYALGIKNGWYQFVDSISVYMNGQELVSQTPYTNMIINAMTMTKWSKDELKLKGATHGVFPDTGGAVKYSTASTTSGDGFYNTTNGLPFVSTAAAGFLRNDYMNHGMKERQNKTTAFDPVNSTLTSMNTDAKAKLINKNYFTQGAVTASTAAGTWNYMVNLPLSILSDLFDKYPLVKGGQLRIVLRYNASVSTVNSVNADAKLKVVTNTQSYGHTNPILMANPLSGSVGITASATNSTHTISTKVSVSSFNISSARLYSTSYRLNPQYESRILSSTPKKEIRYLDVFNQNINTIGSGNSVNQILTTSITNPKYVVVLPFCASKSNSTTMIAASMSQYHSVFDTAPSTTLPYGAIACQQFQVNVANKNMFQQASNYDFEMFQNEVSKLGLNGGIGSVVSGLLDVEDWNTHSYMVCDVSRRLIEDDGSRKAVSVSFTNNSGLTCDYVCFILYEKTIMVDILTGAVERIQ